MRVAWYREVLVARVVWVGEAEVMVFCADVMVRVVAMRSSACKDSEAMFLLRGNGLAVWM